MLRNMFGLLCLLLGTVFTAQQASAQSLVVGPGCQFTNLQTAIDFARGNVAEIHVVNSYVGGAVSISSKTLRIYGGYTDCGGLTQLQQPNGAVPRLVGNSAIRPLLSISGQSSLDLRNFLIENGNDSGHNGGGISFVSSGNFGHLELHGVTLLNNTADKGGGIFFDGESKFDDLTFYDYTYIEGNVANDAGGGVRLQGGVHFIADSPHTIFFNNTANPNNASDGRGGGLQLLDGSTAKIGSPGDFMGIFAFNSARYGGGMAIQDNAQVLLESLPSGPVTFELNTASNTGGGIFVEQSDANLQMSGVTFDGNSAQNGAAVYIDSPRDSECLLCFPTLLTAIGLDNSKLTNNSATQPGSAIVLVQNGRQLGANAVVLSGNSAPIGIRTIGGDSELDISNCSFSGNSFILPIETGGTFRLGSNCSF
jgi:predicted outer membrane repeat protein